MSQTSAGGAAAPGWYTDPHDPRQLRWWSGEGWTEHVSAGAEATQVAQQTGQVAQQTSAAEAAPVQAEAVEEWAPAAAVSSAEPLAPLPSRRALRDPATDAADASNAAESALRVQAQAQVAQAEADQRTQAAAQAHAAQEVASAQPSAPIQQTSAPVPTLPVAATSFLEQQGYTPLDAATVAQPQEFPPVPQPAAVPQPADVQEPAAVPQLADVQQPVELQPLTPIASPVAPGQRLAPSQPNAWDQPAQPDQQGLSSPTQAGASIDSLLGGAPAAAVSAPDAQASQWALSPAGGTEPETRRRSDDVRGSSTLWAWLIAISPILAAGSVAYVLLTTAATLTSWPFWVALAAPYLLVLLFAVADRSVLLQLGHDQPRNPVWALATAPIYLIERASETRRADGSGTVLIIVWAVSFVVAIAGIVGYGLLTHHALISGLPT